MKRFLVTGLCLSRNLGGPAMGLTLVSQLESRYSDADFAFAVSATNLETEKTWGKRYGLKVIPRDNLSIWLSTNLLPVKVLRTALGRSLDYPFWSDVHREYMKAFEWCDYVINMEGISYVGDGTQRWQNALTSYSSLYYAHHHRKPYCRFVQSYGPFTDWRVRLVARRELKRLPFIMARGQTAADYCRRLTPTQEIHAVPDIAILLDQADDEWGQEQLAKWGTSPGDYTVLSPSAIIRSLPESLGGSVGTKHIDSFVEIAETLLAKGERVVFLPHMYSEIATDSDREVARNIIAQLPADSAVTLVEANIDPYQAKWLIGHARQAVVSRYHALVAAVSTATPAVSIGWNVKYRDLLAYYGLEDFAVDARNYPPDSLEKQVLSLLNRYDGRHVEGMRVHQGDNAKKVRAAFERLFKWIDDGT